MKEKRRKGKVFDYGELKHQDRIRIEKKRERARQSERKEISN